MCRESSHTATPASRRSRRCRLGGLLIVAALAPGCTGDAMRPARNAELLVELHGLRPLDTSTEGTYEAWTVSGDGHVSSAGRFDLPPDGKVTLVNPVDEPASFLLTIEPPGDRDASPSELRLLGGTFEGDRATLDITGFITSGVPLEPAPGTHVLFTPSDNAELGYPSHEDAGIWLFNIRGDTLDASFYLTFTPLSRGWIYEGWLVRDLGTADEIWLSYGKFVPDIQKKVRSRDDTGLGPFSGQLEYRTAMPNEIVFPGDDWLANPHGYPLPDGLTLPLDLNGCYRPPSECEAAGHAYGPSRWTHVISIEPHADLGENPWAARPFLVRPYRDPIGEGPPDEARTIVFYPEDLPRGTVKAVSSG